MALLEDLTAGNQINCAVSDEKVVNETYEGGRFNSKVLQVHLCQKK
jgi:hypothetical protein